MCDGIQNASRSYIHIHYSHGKPVRDEEQRWYHEGLKLIFCSRKTLVYLCIPEPEQPLLSPHKKCTGAHVTQHGLYMF